MSHTKEAHFILSADLSSFFLSKQDVIATLYLQKLATAATTNLRKRPKVYYFHCSLHIITLGAHTHISFLSSCNAARASRKWMQKEAAGYGGCGRPMFPQRNVWPFNKKVNASTFCLEYSTVNAQLSSALAISVLKLPRWSLGITTFFLLISARKLPLFVRFFVTVFQQF